MLWWTATLERRGPNWRPPTFYKRAGLAAFLSLTNIRKGQPNHMLFQQERCACPFPCDPIPGTVPMHWTFVPIHGHGWAPLEYVYAWTVLWIAGHPWILTNWSCQGEGKTFPKWQGKLTHSCSILYEALERVRKVFKSWCRYITDFFLK